MFSLSINFEKSEKVGVKGDGAYIPVELMRFVDFPRFIEIK